MIVHLANPLMEKLSKLRYHWYFFVIVGHKLKQSVFEREVLQGAVGSFYVYDVKRKYGLYPSHFFFFLERGHSSWSCQSAWKSAHLMSKKHSSLFCSSQVFLPICLCSSVSFFWSSFAHLFFRMLICDNFSSINFLTILYCA